MKFLFGESKELRKWVIIGVSIGIVAGLGSALFYKLLEIGIKCMLGKIAGYSPPDPYYEWRNFTLPTKRFLLPVVTTLGGLLAGLIIFKFAPEAEGHGTDAAIAAFHRQAGRIRGRVPLVKIIATTLTIGSGGSAGREGPAAQIGAGFGSLIASFLKLNARDRRIALAVGIGAGVGSIFKSPLGGALFGIEVLYKKDFEVEGVIPSFIASFIGYFIFGAIYGYSPIFDMPPTPLPTLPQLILYVILGLACVPVGFAYVRFFYGTRRFFQSMRIPDYIKPAIGGFLTGTIGMFVPQVLEMGYGWITNYSHGEFIIGYSNMTGEWKLACLSLLILMVIKIVTTGLTIGSGGSGGVFAPGLFIGAMLGSALGLAFSNLFPSICPDKIAFISSFTVVGMMAFFSGVAKVPIACIIMVSEMTGSYELLPAAMVSSVLAYMLLGEDTIYHEQVPTRADSPAHLREYEIGLLGKLKVRDAMKDEIPIVKPTSTLEETLEIMEKFDTKWAMVMDKSELLGILTVEDIFMLPPDKRKDSHVKEVMTTNLIVTYEDETLMNALRKMILQGVGQLPVVDRNNPKKLKGAITRCDVLEVYEDKLRKMVNEEL